MTAVISLADQAGVIQADLTEHAVSFDARQRPTSSAPFTATFRYEADATALVELPDSALIFEFEGVQIAGVIDRLVIDDAATPAITASGRTDVAALETVPFPDPTVVDGPQDAYDTYTGLPAAVIEQLTDGQIGAGSQRPRLTVVPSGIGVGAVFTWDVRFSPLISSDVQEICLANDLRAVTRRDTNGLPTFHVEQIVNHTHNMVTPAPGWRLSTSRPEATDWTVGGAGELAARSIGRYHQDPPARFPGRRDKWLERSTLTTFAELAAVAATEAALAPGGWVLEPRQDDQGVYKGGVELLGDGLWGVDVNVGDMLPIDHDLLPEDAVGRVAELALVGGPGQPTFVLPIVGVPSPRGLASITAGLREITSRSASEGGR